MKELGQCIESLGEKPTDEDLKKTFEELDADNSGYIDFPEFARFMLKQMKQSEMQKKRQMKNVLNSNESRLHK